MPVDFETTFRRLINTWEDHEKAVDSGSIARMAAAPAALDAARLEAVRARSTLAS